MRKIILLLYGLLIFILPFVYSRTTEQIFEINKFVFLLAVGGIFCFLFAFVAWPRLFFNHAQRVAVVLAIAFFSILIISTIYAVSPLESFYGGHSHHQGLILFIVVFLLTFFAVLTEPSPQELFWFFLFPLLASGTLEALIAVIQHFRPDFLFANLALNMYQGRSFGTFGQPNFLANFLLFPFFVAFHKLFNAPMRQKIVYLPIIATILAGIVFADSRAGLFALGCGVFLFLLLRVRGWKQALATILIGILLAGGLFVFLAPKFDARAESTETRVLIWQNIKTIIQESHPLYGAGPESQEVILAKIPSQRLFDLVGFNNTLDRAHNELLDIFIQTGGIGLALYLLLLIFALWSGGRKNPLIVPLVATFIARQFGFFSITEFFLFFLLLGLLTFRETAAPRKKPRWHPLFGVSLLLGGVFLFYTAQNIWYAEIIFNRGDTANAYALEPFNRKFAATLIEEKIATEEFAEAKELLSTLSKNHSLWAERHFLAAKSALRQGDPSEARRQIDQALLLFPKNLKYQKFAAGLE